MKIAMFVNDVMTEKDTYTTNVMATAAINRGHEAWVIGADDFSFDKDDKIRARARHAPKSSYKSGATWLQDLKSDRARVEEITVDDLDVLLLRSDPSNDVGPRQWAQGVGIDFGRVALKHGVIVLNDPNGLSNARNKMYFQSFPEEVRPRTLITRNIEKIRKFAREEGNWVVLKPLQGSGGKGVFLVKPDEMSNLNQIVDALSKDGYIIAQEYLPAATKGDIRLFMMNGVPFRVKGKYAAFRRIGAEGDIRSNVHAGGSVEPAIITDEALELANMVRPKLVQDGMFLVGLDIVGNKLMEINVFSPGGLITAQKFEGVNFPQAVIQALEHKVDYMKYYRRNFDNIEMNTL
ncbi:MAG: glutathione synthase [Cyanobacteria bacterium HKST-UBA02]|nr:glutathione synthase [Cyanobacteria bacterium HKST-UBA02]